MSPLSLQGKQELPLSRRSVRWDDKKEDLVARAMEAWQIESAAPLLCLLQSRVDDFSGSVCFAAPRQRIADRSRALDVLIALVEGTGKPLAETTVRTCHGLTEERLRGVAEDRRTRHLPLDRSWHRRTRRHPSQAHCYLQIRPGHQASDRRSVA